MNYEHNLNLLILFFKMSKKRDKGVSLSEKLSSLIHTKPSAVESDDDDLTTVNKITRSDNDSEYSADELDVSTIRRLNNVLLEDEDKKYSGKGVLRKNLNNSLDSDLSEDEENGNEDPENESLSEEEVSDEESEENESGSETEVKNDFDDKINPNNHEKQVQNINKELFLKVGSDIEKGRAISNQLNIWDFLLKSRMKFQKCLVASNQLPNYKTYPDFKSKGHPLFQESVNQCKKSLKHLLNSLLTFQSVLLESNEDFLNSGANEKKSVLSNDDEEITSESEKEDNTENNKNSTSKKLKSIKDFSEEIGKRHESFKNYRNTTIQKWNEKTRIGCISSKNFSAFEQSILKHIEHILLDKQRLLKRTQTKRSEYRILGEEDEPPVKKPALETSESVIENKNKGLCKEIFDDDDFYHQLLNEMVKRKASDVTDPVQLGRQWMQLQKIRSKMKKSVDTKASKGRKVRFVVHPKLVNFMMPVDYSVYNEESKTELFNSLFGKVKK